MGKYIQALNDKIKRKETLALFDDVGKIKYHNKRIRLLCYM